MPRTRPRWWTELPLVIVVYAAYSGCRLLVRGDEDTAVLHGLSLLHAEQSLGMDFETPLNRLLTEHAALGIPAAFGYATLHYLVTPALLVWLWRRRPAAYRTGRSWLLISTLIGLVGFTLVPTCPPRLLAPEHGFTDSMAQYGSYGWWGGEASAPRGLGGLTNQYAAMPSLHVGWAVWCGAVLWRYGGRSAPVRTVAVAYPLCTALTVMGTANHYFFDVLAGGAVMLLGLVLTRPALRLADRAATLLTTRRRPDAEAGRGIPGVPQKFREPRPAPAGARRPAAAVPATASGNDPGGLAGATAGRATGPADRTCAVPAASAVGMQCHTSVDDRFPRPWRSDATAVDDTAAPASR